LRSIFILFATLTIAAISGLGSAYLALRGDPPVGALRIGPWVTWPKSGSRDIDPYARAIVARTGDLPLGLGEGLMLIARSDDTGVPLDARCRYTMAGNVPQARAWTLALYDEHGRLVADATGRTSITSAELLRGMDGKATITLAGEASPGNWLKLPPGGRFSLVIRLYDTPVAAAAGAIDARAMPSLTRTECQ
jgi:hypothetical protein